VSKKRCILLQIFSDFLCVCSEHLDLLCYEVNTHLIAIWGILWFLIAAHFRMSNLKKIDSWATVLKMECFFIMYFTYQKTPPPLPIPVQASQAR
jgi:hypothetical protein